MGAVFFNLFFPRSYRLAVLRKQWHERLDRLAEYLNSLQEKE